MLLEPARTRYDLLFRVGAIPARVHPGFWIAALFTGMDEQYRIDGPRFLVWVGVLFVSILIHELGHAVLMRRFGGRPRVVLYWLGGLAVGERQETADFLAPESSPPLRQVLISLAGPFAGFTLAGLVGLAVSLAGHGDYAWACVRSSFGLSAAARPLGNDLLESLVLQMVWVNLVWGLVNLAPVWPLDGGQVAREILVGRSPRIGLLQSLRLSVATGAALAILALAWQEGRGRWLMFGLFAALGIQSYLLLQFHRGAGFGGSSRRDW